ncbi:hypothetical protein IHE44_0009557 [Lamprotornis superbus]|uniref:C2H2-type domain-containing protein n=1 Tax=Lamprotornis superbus TaxID=245042 RepID=A0A835NM46_9PASS|nr:hypothetical protein IHE44_0009557 [Lamprotornis superbus]
MSMNSCNMDNYQSSICLQTLTPGVHSLTLLEYAEKWKTSEDPLPLLEVYTVAIRSYVKARPYLTSECENVAFVLERLALSCIELLLCLPLDLPENKWEEFQAFVQVAHKNLMENGSRELHILTTLTQEKGVWKNPVLCSILSQEQLDPDKVNEFLVSEGPVLLDMRIKHLMKTKQLTQATALAKLCSDHPEISAKGNFKQTYLVCLCSGSPNERLMEEIAEVDCKDALEMICNLESDGDEKSALILCAAFLSRQLQQGEMYCAWELTLFWSKLQQRVEPSIQIDGAGLATCIELCVKALRLESSENADVKISVCKTISCLLPDDLEVKRACQLSEFLLEPTVDAYYAVEMLYNQPDQKYDEENLPIPNSLRCELLLVLKTQWPFDPEFWDWKTLKRQCLALMGEEASIVSSIDELNDSEVYEKVEDGQEDSKETSLNGLAGIDEANSLLRENFVPHVTLHVKKSSKERLAAMKPLRRLGRPPKMATANENQKTNSVSKQEQRPIKKNSLYSTDFIVFNDNDGSDDENDDKDKPYIPEIVPVQKPPPVNEFTCPVTLCKKGFKYFKNLIAHAKGHKDNEEAKRFLEMQSKKVICQYCRRHFVSVTHLNDHLQMHCGSKPYICIQMKCKAGFNSYAELLTHRREHQVFRAKCMFPKCGRVFSEAYLLYDHEAQHYNTYTCRVTGCGKVYRSQNELEKHIEDHNKQPEKEEQPENQTNQPDPSQPSKANESTDGVAIKEELTSPPAENRSSFIEGENVWNQIKAEPVGNESVNVSVSVLQQSNSLPNAGSEQSPVGSIKTEETVPAGSIKLSVNQKIRDNFVKRVFQERKEEGCRSQTQNIQTVSVTSNTLKPEALESKSLERQVSIVNPFSVQNQTGYRNGVPISKLEIEDSIKAAANLYNLPLKTLESITFIPSQPNQPQESAFNPETCFKDPSFLQLLAAENRSTLQTMFPRANVTNFNTSGNEEVKTENGDSQMMAANSCVQANSEEQISQDSVMQNFEKTLEIIKTAMNSQMLEVKTEIQDTVAASGQNLQVNNAQVASESSAHSVKLPTSTQFAVHTGNVTAVKGSSTQSEISQKDDTQMSEILEGLQKLKLEDDSPIPISETVSQCLPADKLAPAVPVISVENKPLIQLSPEASNIQFSDRVNKPFVCQNPGCNYSAMTKDALFKHYGKIHQYTAEMILEIKKHQLKYAPFKCVVATCPKTFTRNSNLRAHCQLVHHFTTEEMEQAKVRKVRKHRKEKEERNGRKPVTKSLEFPNRYSPYRPYRCVHQGCFAAFTIQQNLILHYQAVHKSDLPAFSAEVEEENEQGKEEQEEVETKPAVREFRCEVSDCSRIFQEVTSLIQHYMKLHDMTPEQIGNMKSAPEVGRFFCDQSQCKSSFTAYINYVVHLETDHSVEIKPNKVEDDGMFKCDCEGCDRIYATRSNLLRHIFNKHNDRHKDHLIRPRRLTPGQENISSKANQEKPLKSKQRGLKNRSGKEGNRLSVKTKRKKNVNLENKNSKGIQVQENKAYSLKRGKNLLIVSKKHPVSQEKEASCEQEETDKKTDVKEPEPSLIASNNDSSTTTLPQKETEKGEKDEVDELTELFITKLVNEDCSAAENQAKISSSVNSDLQESSSCPSEKQKSNNLKRANKEKNVSQSKRKRAEKTEETLPSGTSSLHKEEETAVAIQTAEEQPAAFDWSSFKPMGFEVSFLKFLEESAVKQKKNSEREYHSGGTKKGSHSNARKASEKAPTASDNITWLCSETETLVPFANPSRLPCGDNVKIVLDKTLKDCTERVLKQLQEMKPIVSLRKLEGPWEDNPEVIAAKAPFALLCLSLTVHGTTHNLSFPHWNEPQKRGYWSPWMELLLDACHGDTGKSPTLAHLNGQLLWGLKPYPCPWGCWVGWGSEVAEPAAPAALRPAGCPKAILLILLFTNKRKQNTMTQQHLRNQEFLDTQNLGFGSKQQKSDT